MKCYICDKPLEEKEIRDDPFKLGYIAPCEKCIKETNELYLEMYPDIKRKEEEDLDKWTGLVTLEEFHDDYD